MDFIHHLDPSPLTLLCTIHHVDISIAYAEHTSTWVGDQFTVEFYATTYESVVLHCHPVSQDPCAASPKQANDSILTITIPSQSQAYLHNKSILRFPHEESGEWALNCSASDADELSTLQDVLTYFIKYENQHQMRNTLAMMDPASCQITQVIAQNVHIDRSPTDANSEAESLNNDDDFITTRENYYGQKLPVTMDDNVFKDGLELRRVRLMNKTSHCMDVGSDWIARSLIRAGDSVASYIQTGTKSVEESVEPTGNQLILSTNERHYFDIIYGMAVMAGGAASRWISQLFNITTDRVNDYCGGQLRIPSPRTQLGNAAMQAAGRIAEGTAIAAGTVYAASRDSFVDVIRKKYGHDAGYVAEKMLGKQQSTLQGADAGGANGGSGNDVLVYFDHQGISRRVVMQAYPDHLSSLSQDDAFMSVPDHDDTLSVDTRNHHSANDDDDRHLVFDAKEHARFDSATSNNSSPRAPSPKEQILVHV
ncbi:hypothetical protein BC940DRAFT_290687 [Gongronella butleri]|nr:hypothetical protein BC940DRAFT_290687 [Gongronella butleri]